MRTRVIMLIRCYNDRTLFWSNEWGWGSRRGCERFTWAEHRRVRLPMEGEWYRMTEGAR